MKTETLDELISTVKDDVIKWRRHFHQNPELSFKEEKTSQFIYDTLQTFENLVITRPTKTSVVARLIGSQPGKVLALRADIDALPIHEETDLPFASKNPGVMHACGHDGHTAMLLGAVKIFTQLKEQIKGELRFIFQHAEEDPPGGAVEMVKAGVMEGVDMVTGIHVASQIPVGKFGVAYGTLTSATDKFYITINGKGGHSSQPENTVDPVVIAAQIITNLQQIVSRNISASEKAVVSITQFKAGDAYNIIPDSVVLGGSTRTFNPDVRKLIPERMESIVKGIAEGNGASYHLDYMFGYNPVINDEAVTKVMENTIRERWGDDAVEFIPPLMGGEDFSAFADKAPGCFIHMGAGNEEKHPIHPHHHPKFAIDEDALMMGVELFIYSSFKLLD
ncbi:M20 metallopeptidase family protein [Scopulibacillus cellulosilyticus]|uniref:M20 family metallopeptidase n=1 Tax=Scopulibacillus cellulosilyticus TaxID=2665665 RepID=A0ABW2Q5Y1_9BACL